MLYVPSAATCTLQPMQPQRGPQPSSANWGGERELGSAVEEGKDETRMSTSPQEECRMWPGMISNKLGKCPERGTFVWISELSFSLFAYKLTDRSKGTALPSVC